MSGFSGGAMVKNLPANARDTRDADSIPALGRSPEGNPFQHSGLENSMDREAWRDLWSRRSQRVGHN